MHAIAYLRVSTTGQVDEGVSLEVQRAKVEAWAALHDAQLVAVYSDDGVSGKTATREGLQAALEAAKAHNAALVVYSLSRLSRSTLDTLRIASELEACGCDLVSIQEQVDTTTPAGRVIFRVLAALAEFEREQLVDRTRQALAYLKAQGRRTGSVPHGYADDDGRLVKVESEQRILRLVAELREQGYSLRAISAELEARGCFNRAGRPFNPKSVRSMLRGAPLQTPTRFAVA